MFRAPIWITSATSATSSMSRTSISSVTIGRPVSALAPPRAAAGPPAEALERVRRGPRLVGAAAEHARPAVGDGPRHLERLRPALDRAGAGDQGEVVAADLAAVHVDDCALALAELSRGELVRLEDRHQVVDAGGALQAQGGDPVAVADGADDGQELSAGHVGGAADRLHAVDDGLDLLLRRPLFHHDHHGLRKPFKEKMGTPARYGVRRKSPARWGRDGPAGRLAKSPVVEPCTRPRALGSGEVSRRARAVH